MESLITLSRNVLQRIGAVNARLLGILRIAYDQMVALFARPAMRHQHVGCLQITPRGESPSSVTEECDQDKPDEPDKPEDEYAIMNRESAAADQMLMRAITAWKQSEVNLVQALLAGKRHTFTAHDEIQDLEDANNKAEDEMIDAIRDRTRLHMQHCAECDRIINEYFAAKRLKQKALEEEKLAAEVKDPPRKLLAITYGDEAITYGDEAITYGDDKTDEVFPRTLNRCELLALPAPEVFQKVIELPPCQVEKKALKQKSRPLKKKAPQPKPRWR